MSRSGYVDDLDSKDWAMWRGRVASATRGKRGQEFLRDLLAALDAMPVKELVVGALEEGEEVCAVGALGRARGIDMSKIDPEDGDQVGEVFDISPCLAKEVVYTNDEWVNDTTPAHRWKRMREWVAKQIKSSEAAP